MFSSDKRASLTSGLLAAKEQALSGEDGASDVPPAASLVALPRGGARQRLISAVRRKDEAAGAENSAPATDDAAAPAEAVAPPAPAPPPAQPPNPPNSVLASKGDASASGFRPWYWSYERDGGPASSDSAGTVARFPASAPAPVSPPDPVSAPATADAVPHRAAPRRAAKLGVGLLAGFSTLALVGAATLFLLSRSETPQPSSAPAAVVARALPLAAPVPPPPRATRVAPLPKPAPAPAPVESRHPAAEATSDITELMTRGDEMLATGDVAAARLFYERAAESGNPAAERQAGKTYDPLFLAETHVRGLQGDPVAAARWYRKASAGGDREADALMKRLMARYAH
jgi:hypothetical protein